MFDRISTLYFSGTGTTKKVVLSLMKSLAVKIEKPVVCKNVDFSLPDARKQALFFTERDLVIVGIPVYAGRVPNVLLKYLNSVKGNGAQAIAVVLYGNRNFDDSLIELTDILLNNRFKVIAAGAFIGEHSFSKILAQGRPDKNDMKKVVDFAQDIYDKLNKNTYSSTLLVRGQRPYRKYYQPKDRFGNIFDFQGITPHTKKDICIDCKHCVEICSMGSISSVDTSLMNGICIKCCACIKGCPVEAKSFDNENYKKHQYELEEIYYERQEPETFL